MNRVINSQSDSLFTRTITLYIVCLVIGVLCRSYIINTSAIVWIINLIGLLILFFPYYRHAQKYALRHSIIYIVCCTITIAVNSDLMTGSIKSIGTNVNIIVFPIFYIINEYLYKEKMITERDIIRLFKFISILGTISTLFALLNGVTDYVQVFSGKLNPYFANIYGFYYGKNIYGSIVSLTIIADLYLYNRCQDRKRLLLIILKSAGVLFSFSRAAILQFVIMFYVYIWFNRKKYKKIWISIVFISLVILTIVLLNQSVLDFILKYIVRSKVGDAGRGVHMQRAISIVGEKALYMFFGVGYAGIDSLGIDIDNTYLYIFFSGGITKVLMYVFITAIIIKRLIALRKMNLELCNMCVAIFISYLFYSFFESVAIFEIGMNNFMYTFYIAFVPSGYNGRYLNMNNKLVE